MFLKGVLQEDIMRFISLYLLFSLKKIAVLHSLGGKVGRMCESRAGIALQ